MIRTDVACCFTGHREIPTEDLYMLVHKLELKIRDLIQNGSADFITGGARGFDTLAAGTILTLRNEFPHIRLILALPCKEQTKGWKTADVLLYQQIMQQADIVHYVSESYDRGCMMRRNRFMVDHSRRCVFYLTHRRSGTYKTVEYAMQQSLTLYNILI
ncbi:SLOG family protein [Ructibacterium gallinarum]|uniref:DUF1273 family protein n=1 Tax=Ructibacterium gallinarum TaxID=2779355 RepID=A0A9D5M063_9FIRM|nr:SLOG family protein [Ructibacterium gallinarum]MBE5040222.1 DUF1273 family protein [Ructibacterium gallinarum]